MARCKHFEPKKKNCKENCANCIQWGGKRCKIEQQILDELQDSNEFKAYDRMMRDNRGVILD